MSQQVQADEIKRTKTPLVRLLPYLGLACTSLFWAGNALVARGFNNDIAPLALAFHRWLLCAVLVLPFIIRAFKRHRQVIREYRLKLTLLAFLSITCFNSLLYMSAQHTTALNITLVNSLMPVTTLVLAIPLLQQRITLKNSIGVLLAFLGALTVILQGNMAQLWTLGINQGDGIMTIAMICWSVYTLLLRKWNIPIPGFDLFAIMLGIGLTLLTPFYLWELRATGGFLWNREIVAVIVYVALFPSLLAYLFWNYGVTETSPSTAALFAYLTPLITALLAVPLLNETPHFYHVMGGTAILAGLWLSYDIGQTNAISLQKDASG